MGGYGFVGGLGRSSGDDGEEYLRAGTLAAYFEGSERLAHALTNEKRGVTRVDEGDEERIRPAESGGAVAAVTDERVLIVVETDGGPRAVTVPHARIRAADASKGVLTSWFVVATWDGPRYRFPVRGRVDLDDVVGYVERAADHWVEVDSRLERARRAIAAIESRLDDGETDAATDACRTAADHLDVARERAKAFRDGEHAMHRRLDQAATRLTLAKRRCHRVRARQHRQDAERARERGDYRDARDGYRAAREQYDRAIDLTDAADAPELEALQAAHEAVDRALDQLATEPLVAAMDACERAREADEPAVEPWEEALSACRRVVGLVHRDPFFDGAVDALRMQVAWVVGNLLDARRNRALECERRGDEARENCAAEAAREAYDRAVDHAGRARDLAAEFRTGDTESAAALCERLREKREALDGTASQRR